MRVKFATVDLQFMLYLWVPCKKVSLGADIRSKANSPKSSAAVYR